jgi:superfamily II DNA or RNA helicase
MAQITKITGLASAVRGCASWQDIQNKWRGLSEKQKGDLFEEFVKAYLQLDPEYASKLKHVWLGSEVPQATARRLKLPATDQGIDIVAETHDGEFWAIQCKYRQDTDHSLTWRDLSTFTGLAFGVCRGFSFGIICSTTERITHVLKDQDRIGFCALDVWQSLDSDYLKRLRTHLAHKPALLKPLKPRPHQKVALKDGHEHFVIQKAKRGKLIMPCGSGKSLTAWWIAEKLESRRIVIAVPSLALIRQTLKVWLRETTAKKLPVEWICICSDESAGRVDRDDTAVLRQDLGVPCLTDSKEIEEWLKRKHSGLTIVFTTYQSGEALARAARSAKFTFDLGIMDEAHKTVGDGEKLFSHLLHDKNLPIRRRLFMTATERRYAGQSDTVLSMDDPAVYGETFHLLSFKRAMEYNPPILSDYKIISIAVSREEVAELIRNNAFVRPDKGPWNEEIEADMLASLIALRKAMQKYPILHAVSFHGSIQRAELFKTHNDAFSQSFRNYGKLETFHVSGKTPTGTRARVISEFARAERALITNARCLTEGVDVPGIDCVLFADPRRSAVDIVQAVGRALRPAPGKEFGYVIVPILHDADATSDDIFKSAAFKEILTTLRALAANDDRIIEYFRGVSQGRQRKGGGSMKFDIDERLAQQIDLSEFVREIELKCWDRLEGLLKDRLTIDQILEWADKHHIRTGIWPNMNSGDVPPAPGETWKNIDTALRQGNRGLSIGSSLPQLLGKERGVRNIMALPDLTTEQILKWADGHYRETGDWPKDKSGEVLGESGERWRNIQNALVNGSRGLPGGSSLIQLLAENRGVRNKSALQKLTCEQILHWADIHKKTTGQWPNQKSGKVLGESDESWVAINSALHEGCRGFSGGSSLAHLLAENRGIRNKATLPRLTIEQILQWSDAHRKRTGQWPNQKSGEVLGEPGEKWANINSCLNRGLRNLPSGSSLAQVLVENRGIRNTANLPRLTIEQILQWADAHCKRTGKWPNQKSGKVFNAPDETWQNIIQALQKGLRGLASGFSLIKLLEEKRGVRNSQALPELTNAQILKWADAHHKQTHKWPNRATGDIIDAHGEKWANIDASLTAGRRSLPGDSSLAKLLAENRGVQNAANLPRLTTEQILQWADAHHQRTGKWPNVKTGEVLGEPGEKWANIVASLFAGRRGLPGGSSLAKLIESKRNAK